MSLESDVQTLLAGVSLATGGVFQTTAKQGVAAPYIVWDEIISTTNNTLNGASNIQNTRIQVDCYAKTPDTRRTLRDAVTTAMAAATFKNVQLTSQHAFEADVKLYRAILDFSVWSL
jgi:hypothetical protein